MEFVSTNLSPPGVESSDSSKLALSKAQLAAHMKNLTNPKAAMKYQLGWTLCGSCLFCVCITLMGVTWAANWEATKTAMGVTTLQFRKAQASQLSLELAALLRPLYTTASSFAIELEYTDLRAKLTTEAFYDSMENANQLATLFYGMQSRRAQVRSMNADGSDRVLTGYMAVVAALSVDSTGQPTSAFEIQNCNKALFTALLLDSPDPLSEGYTVDIQNSLSDGSPMRRFYSLNVDTCTVGALVVEKPPLPCGPAMGPLLKGYRPPGFDNFTWFGPHDPGIGWGNLFLGSVPLYDDARTTVGRFSFALSLGKSVGPLLEAIVELGGDIMAGGHIALYTAGGLVMGLTEAGASPGDMLQAKTLQDVVNASTTGRALALVKETQGTICPDRQTFITGEELVDVTPFRTEDYGLPPLGEMWCQLTILPRKNVFEAIDTAASSGIRVGLVALVGFSLALLMLLWSLNLAYRAHVQMSRERKANLRERIKRADSLLGVLSAPMVLMSAEVFLGMSQLEHMEGCRDAGRLRFFDSAEEVESFRADGNLVVFISHQWLAFDFPDDEEQTQFNIIKQAIRQILEMKPQQKVFVWLDYFSVPQKIGQMLALAISTLPTYVAMSDYFITCAPDAMHVHTGRACDLATYSRRGWCRLEMLAKVCSSGLRNMFVCCGNSQELKCYSKQDFGDVSLKAFLGDYTVRKDMESLVEPVLGLYAMIMRQVGQPHIDPIHAEIELEKEKFFPSTYQPDDESEGKRLMLFGPLIQMMEHHVSQTPHGPLVKRPQASHAKRSERVTQRGKSCTEPAVFTQGSHGAPSQDMDAPGGLLPIPSFTERL